jgi:hypothetical protein
LTFVELIFCGALKISDSELKLKFEFSSRAENIGAENIGIEL